MIDSAATRNWSFSESQHRSSSQQQHHTAAGSLHIENQWDC